MSGCPKQPRSALARARRPRIAARALARALALAPALAPALALALSTQPASADPYRLRGDVYAFATAPSPTGLVVLSGQAKPSDWANAEAVLWTGLGQDSGGLAGDVLVANVRLHHDRAPTSRLDLCLRVRSTRGVVAVVDDNIRAFARELDRRCLPYPRVGPGDHCAQLSEPAHLVSPSVVVVLPVGCSTRR